MKKDIKSKAKLYQISFRSNKTERYWSSMRTISSCHILEAIHLFYKSIGRKSVLSINKTANRYNYQYYCIAGLTIHREYYTKSFVKIKQLN